MILRVSTSSPSEMSMIMKLICIPEKKNPEKKNIVDEILKRGVIQHSYSHYASPTILIEMKNRSS